MSANKIIESIKQGMRLARFQDMRKRQAAQALREAENPERYFTIHDIHEKIKNNSRSYTINYLKKHWTAGDDELQRQINILVENEIIKNADTVFDIQSEAASAELLCLLNFWKNHGFMKFKRFPFKKICRSFTSNGGNEYNPDELKGMQYNYSKTYEVFSNYPHERYTFFENKLLNQ